MPDLKPYFSAVGDVIDFAERHPLITIAVLILLALFGSPELGPTDKPWVRRRDGLIVLAMRGVEKYAERTQVFRGIEDEVKAFREQSAATEKRVGKMEHVVDWQTQVLIAIASVLKVDPLALLKRTEINQAGVSAVATRDSLTDVGGKQGEKSVQPSTSTS